MTKLEKMKGDLLKVIKERFNEAGEMGSPVWFFEGDDENSKRMALTPFRNNQEKEMTIEGIKLLFKKFDVKRFVFVVEAWTVTKHSKDPEFNEELPVPPSQHPDRVEVVMVTGEDRDTGESFLYQYKIDRSGPKPTLIVDEDTFSTYTNMGGRFTNIFEKPTASSRVKH